MYVTQNVPQFLWGMKMETRTPVFYFSFLRGEIFVFSLLDAVCIKDKKDILILGKINFYIEILYIHGCETNIFKRKKRSCQCITIIIFYTSTYLFIYVDIYFFLFHLPHCGEKILFILY
ncbi:UNVERIFIED_CONTAM: hypothetical protein K2H54_060822 [Gekko kuhli]